MIRCLTCYLLCLSLALYQKVRPQGASALACRPVRLSSADCRPDHLPHPRPYRLDGCLPSRTKWNSSSSGTVPRTPSCSSSDGPSSVRPLPSPLAAFTCQPTFASLTLPLLSIFHLRAPQPSSLICYSFFRPSSSSRRSSRRTTSPRSSTSRNTARLPSGRATTMKRP